MVVCRVLQLTGVSPILEPALWMAPKWSWVFGFYGLLAGSWRFRLRCQMSPLRRGFLISGPRPVVAYAVAAQD